MVWDSLSRGEISISYLTTGHDTHQHSIKHEINIIYLVANLQKMHCIAIIMTIQLMLSEETNAIYCDNHTKKKTHTHNHKSADNTSIAKLTVL
jgi:hypothetical protein